MTIHIDSLALPDELEFDRMRADLLRRIETEQLEAAVHVPSPRRRIRRPGRVLAIVSGVAAAALVGAGLATGGFGIVRAGEAAQAAEILHKAADGAITTSDPVLQPGQFLKITTHEDAWMEIANSTNIVGKYRIAQNFTLYIPADRSGTWTLVRAELPPSDPDTDAARQDMKDWKPSPILNATYSGPGGDIPNWINPSKQIDQIAPTTDAMLDYLYKGYQGGNTTWTRDGYAWQRATDALMFTYVPAAQRAALYNALTELAGVRVTDEQVAVDGRHGVGIGIDDPHLGQVELIIDPTTGEYLGKRDDGMPGLPIIDSVHVAVVNQVS